MNPRYKKYRNGTPLSQFMGPDGGGPAIISQLPALIDAVDTPNQYGNQSMGGSVLKGAASGAALGSSFGPIGTGVGAVIGGGIAAFSAGKARREEKNQRLSDQMAVDRYHADRSAAMFAQSPELLTGGKQYFYQYGGKLTGGNIKTEGGQLKKLSSTTHQVIGPDHNKGGVKLPSLNAEVEGGETITNGYVFSDDLGFAKLHKPLAKAIGRIEAKPKSAARNLSLAKLKDREQQLMMAQEQYKTANNL